MDCLAYIDNVVAPSDFDYNVILNKLETTVNPTISDAPAPPAPPTAMSDILDPRKLRLEAPTDDNENIADWQDALDNSYVQLEAQSNRLVNLELMSSLGSAMWKAHIVQLEGNNRVMTARIDAVKEDIIKVNRKRKEAQLRAGGKLATIEEKRRQVMASIVYTDHAIMMHLQQNGPPKS